MICGIFRFDLVIFYLSLALAMYFHCISFSSYVDLLSCLLPLGLAFGSMCFMAPGARRSRSPRRSTPEEVHGLVLRLPYDPLNPYDPPLTVYTEHRFTDLPHLPSQPPTSPISSRDFSSRSRSPVPPILQTKSLPPLRRRRRHLREPAVEAPIIFTPSVTLEEAPHSEQPPSSSATHPASRTTPSSPVHQSSPEPVGTTPKAKPAPSKPVTTKVPHRRSNPTTSEIPGKSFQASSRPIPKDDSKRPITSTPKPPVDKSSTPVALVESSEYTYGSSSSSGEESSDTSKPTDVPKANPLVLRPDSISSLAISGPPKAGKSTLGSAMNLFIQGTPQTTTSKKFYKWTNEKENVNMYHYCNDTFASSDTIDWDRLAQSVNSTQYQPGRHFIIIEGHRLFESEAIMALSHQVVILTGTHYTLRNRKIPTPETSFQLYCDRIRPLLPELNASKNILKLDARNSPESMVKKVGAFLAMSNLGFQHCGKRMSDTKNLLEISENN